LLVLITIVGILAGSGTAAAAARDTDQIVAIQLGVRG